MIYLTPAQIRGARAMLNWSMLDLSRAARVSVSSIKRYEDSGLRFVSLDIVAMMEDALETAGVDFLADDGNGAGLRLRNDIGHRHGV